MEDAEPPLSATTNTRTSIWTRKWTSRIIEELLVATQLATMSKVVKTMIGTSQCTRSEVVSVRPPDEVGGQLDALTLPTTRTITEEVAIASAIAGTKPIADTLGMTAPAMMTLSLSLHLV